MKKILILILTLYCCRLNGQQMKIGIESGLGKYYMSDLKAVNDFVLRNQVFDTKLVSDFPPFLYYRIKILMGLPEGSIGLIYTFQSTGSRISGKDYSGEYVFDILVNSHVPGIYFERRMFSGSKFDILLYLTGGCILSNLEFNESLDLSDLTIYEYHSGFRSINFSLEPGLHFTLPYKRMGFGANIGYMLQIGQQAFYQGGNKENELHIQGRRETIKPGWKGIRMGISLSYNLFKSEVNSVTSNN